METPSPQFTAWVILAMSVYSQICLQIVFAVYGRSNFLFEGVDEEVYRYMSGIVTGNKQKSLGVNGMPDHVHLVIGLEPSMRISDLVREIKSESSKFINKKNWLSTKFRWQEGYGVFSYSRSQVGAVVEYVKNQKLHHRRRPFREEYMELLKRFDISFDPAYTFEFYD